MIASRADLPIDRTAVSELNVQTTRVLGAHPFEHHVNVPLAGVGLEEVQHEEARALVCLCHCDGIPAFRPQDAVFGAALNPLSISTIVS